VKVVAAGGTGFLGRSIVRDLLRAGHDVTVLSRNPDSVPRLPELRGANATRGDVTDPASLTGRLDGADAVVNCVQFPNHPVEVPRKGLTYDRYDRQGTENLLAEASRAGVERFFYLSGAGADPSSDKSWYRAKGKAEGALRSSGLQWSILRPSWAYGPGDKALNRLAKIARFSPVVPQLGVRPQRIQPVYVEDVSLTVRRIFERDAWGEIFEIGSQNVMTMHEVLETLLDVMGKRRWIVPVPIPLAKLGTAPLVLLPAPPMTPQGIEFAVQDGVVDISAARERLGVSPLPLKEGLSRYIHA
jgi:NADH dehydrogenase